MEHFARIVAHKHAETRRLIGRKGPHAVVVEHLAIAVCALLGRESWSPRLVMPEAAAVSEAKMAEWIEGVTRAGGDDKGEL